MTPPRVRMSGITRRFGAVTALDGARLVLDAGEVHGVLGENGAGKTTLLSILAGMRAPDSGSIEVDGERVIHSTPREAWRHGITMVHQHFKLVAELSVLENLSLGMRAKRGGLGLPFDRVRDEVAELGDRTGLRVDLDRRVGGLGVGARQRVEILKALLRDPRVLVLDEPTAVLTPDEVASLFGLLRSLASEGTSVALVAHKLDEVMAVSDRYTVLRDGRTVLEGRRGEVDAAALVRAMVGGPSSRDMEPGAAPAPRDGPRGGARGEVVAALLGVSVRGDRGSSVREASLEVRRGEVVGIAGVEGNGQRELALVLAGRIRPDEGRAELPAGIGFVPQDRTKEGLVADFDLTENVALAWHHGRGLMPWARVRARAETIRRRFDVRAPGVGTRAGALSGGNQQRLVVGRELDAARDLLVAENPSRGLDIAATAFVRGRLGDLADGGRRATPGGAAGRGGPDGSGAGAESRPADRDPPGIVLISSDLDEVLALSDRVFVMVRGRLEAVPRGARSREGVGALMLGGGQ